MKKTFRFALTALLVGGLSFAVTSCKDDDKDNDNGSGNGEPTAEELAVEHAETFWAVAANLVSPFDVTTEYENKTFEPTIGSPLDGNSTIRVVSTGDMSAAAKRFADLTGAPVDENTTTYTYEDDAVGTLVYTKTNDATSLAKVDVSIKQIPHLQQIVYMTPEQMGTNGTFRGNSYYSFGDIILRYNQDESPEYWVCVRPALGPAGKEDTHWMTVSKLPDDNIRLLEENRKVVAAVPTQLGKCEEHMQNLAEMLYAMFNPEQWQENIEQNSSYGILGAKGLPIFHDMKPERVQYFNKYFWTLLEKDWEKNELFQMIFGYSAEQMKGYVNSADGLFLLGKGYTGTAGLYQWQFKNGDGSKSNLHDMKYSVVKKTGIALENAKLYYGEQYKNNHWVNEAFFGDPNPRFVIRIATGKQLAGQDPGPRFSLATNTNKIKDTFVFNKVHNVTISPNIDPKVYTEADVDGYNVDAANMKVGSFIGKDGKFYDTKADADQNGNGAVAMVVYYNARKKVDAHHDYHGLAIALTDLKEPQKWIGESHDLFKSCLHEADITSDYSKLTGMMNGIDLVDSLSIRKAPCGSNDHPVIEALKRLEPTPNGMSAWFVPTTGQLILAMEGMGLQLKVSSGSAQFEGADGKKTSTVLANWLKDGDCAPFDEDSEYWTCTGYASNGMALFWYMDNDFKLKVKTAGEASSVRPFLAF